MACWPIWQQDATRSAGWMPVSRNMAASTSGGLNLPISLSRVLSDTGQGLTPEESRRLFTPNYTTKAHGTGLGLAIVQSVVSDHHGRISVESAPGKGATFRIDLA
jgi:signal transduction histidine kinase